MSKDIDNEIDLFLAEKENSIDSEIDQFLKEKDPSFEDRYLQPIYNVANPILKGLSVLGKPLSLAGAAGRSTGKFISGQEDASSPLMTELGTIFPTQEGNPLAGLETIEGMGDPLIQSPESLKENAPKLASFVEQSSTPANISQSAIDAILGVAASKANIPSDAAIRGNYRNWVADKYLAAIQKEPSLMDTFKASGKWEDIVSYLSDNPEFMKPFGKEKALDELQGPLTKRVDEYGIVRTGRDSSSGVIGKYGKEIDEILSPIKSDRLIDPVQLRSSAYGFLDDRMLGNDISSAQKKIDDIIPQVDFDVEKLNKLKKVDEYPLESDLLANKIIEEQNAVEDMLQRQKIEESLSLSEIPRKTEYVTEISYPDDPEYMGVFGAGPRPSKTITSVDDNFDFLTKKAEVDQKIYLLNQEIEGVRKLNLSRPENYNKLSNLIKERNILDDYFNKNFDPSLLGQKHAGRPITSQVEAYKNMIEQRGMLPAGYASEFRKDANRMMDTAKIGIAANPIESGAMHEAGRALHKASSEAEKNVLAQYLEPDQIKSFMKAKRNQELSIALKDLMDKNRIVKDNAGKYVPVGALDRGLAREFLTATPEYILPYTSKAADAISNTIIPYMKKGNQVAYPIEQMINRANQPQPSRQPQSVTDFIPRGIPLQDPMMKAHAIDAIGRDKQNTPARNAERMMKIINEGIFED